MEDLKHPLRIVWAKLDSGTFWPAILQSQSGDVYRVRLLNHKQRDWLSVGVMVPFDACVRDLPFKSGALKRSVEMGLFLLSCSQSEASHFLSGKGELPSRRRRVHSSSAVAAVPPSSIRLSPCNSRKQLGLLKYLDLLPTQSVSRRKVVHTPTPRQEVEKKSTLDYSIGLRLFYTLSLASLILWALSNYSHSVIADSH